MEALPPMELLGLIANQSDKYVLVADDIEVITDRHLDAT